MYVQAADGTDSTLRHRRFVSKAEIARLCRWMTKKYGTNRYSKYKIDNEFDGHSTCFRDQCILRIAKHGILERQTGTPNSLAR